jgi:hypothetical protein
MNSYRCPQCHLVCWATAEVCKRCGTPNPGLAQNFTPDFQPQTVAPDTAVTWQTPATVAQFAPPYHTPPVQHQYAHPGYQTPAYPPASYNQPQPYPAYTPVAGPSPEQLEEITAAQNLVRNAWRAGLAWSIILGIAFIAFAGLSVAFGNDPKAPSELTTGMALVLGVMTFLIFGLSYGVKQQSFACGVILIILTSLGLLNSLAEGKVSPVLFSIVMLVFFGQGLKGIAILRQHE